MLVTVSLAPSSLVIERGATRQQKHAAARAAATQSMTVVRTDLEALLECISRRGNIYYPARLKQPTAGTTTENFEASNLVVLDIDNSKTDREALTWSKALTHSYIQQFGAFLHESPNYSREQNRFRIGFILPAAIEDYHSYKQVAERMLEEVLGAEYAGQGELILRPTWGYKGCRYSILGPGRTQVISHTEFERLTADIAEVVRRQTERRRQNEEDRQLWGKITADEVERMLGCIPAEPGYEQWQAIVFGIATHFHEEPYEAIRLIEQWSPGRDKHYLKLIRSATRRNFSGGRVLTIATVIAIAKQFGYEPPRPAAPTPGLLRFDHTITINRWVTEAEDQLLRIIADKQKTIIVSRTGNGKSAFVKALAAKGRVLLISPLAKLAEQQAEEFSSVGAVAVTGGENAEIAELYFRFQAFVCTTPEMAGSYIDCIEQFDYVVIDEIHELRRITYRPAAMAAMGEAIARAKRVIGLTATPTDDIFHAQGFYTVLVADRRTDRVPIQIREFTGGAIDEDGNTTNDTTALVARIIREHLAATGQRISDDLLGTPPETGSTEQNEPAQQEYPICVIRLQSKKQLRTIADYCTKTLQMPQNAIAVLTSENKNASPVFEAIVRHRHIPAGVRLVLTTSVFDVGLNVLNTNIARLVLVEPQDAIEAIQFSARFRNCSTPVECFYRQRKEKERPDYSFDLLSRYRRDLAKATDLADTLTLTLKPGNKDLFNRVSVSSKFKAYVRRVGDCYKPNSLYIAAFLYREHCGALVASNSRFFDALARQYTYCDVHTMPTLDLDTDTDVELMKQQLKEQEKSIENALYTCLREHRQDFFTNVFVAYAADRELRTWLLQEFSGLRPLQDQSSKELVEHYRQVFGENIFLRPLARTITRRYLHLRGLKLDTANAVRLVDTYRTPEQWHNTVLELETLLRQYLLEHHPEALSPKWKHEAEAVHAVAHTLYERKEILTADVLNVVNTVMVRHLFAMKKREASKLVRILFGRFRRRGREKITYYDCRSRRSLQDTLAMLAIDAAGYLETLQTTASLGSTLGTESLPDAGSSGATELIENNGADTTESTGNNQSVAVIMNPEDTLIVDSK